MFMIEERLLATRGQVERALGNLAFARQLAGTLNPLSPDAIVVNAGLDLLTRLLGGVEALAENAEAVARLSERDRLSVAPNECFLESS